MKSRFSLIFTIIAASLSVSVPASATFYQSSSGLVSSDQTITFNEVSLSNFQSIGNAYAGFGVTFQNLFQVQNAGPTGVPNLQGNLASNFPITGCPFGACGSFEIDFTAPVTAAVFAFITNTSSSPSIIRSFLGANLVETASVFTNLSNPNDTYGFTSCNFDRILVTTETAVNGAAEIDILQFNFAAAVPEPSTWAMMILGFAGVGLMAYRRKSR